MLKKPPRVRDNNGALQVRLRLGGRDHFINRIGRFDDPVAQARGQAICAEIWRDAQRWASRQISAQMACPLAWATGSSKRPIRLMKWSRPPNLNLTWRAPLLSLTLGGFFSIPLLYMGFGLRADTPNAKPDQQIQ